MRNRRYVPKAVRKTTVTCCLLAGLAGTSAERPLASAPRALALPAALGPDAAVPLPSPVQARGACAAAGAPAWARYGQEMLLLVGNGAPFAQAQAGLACLTGAGHDLVRVGLGDGALPAVIYNSVGPDGRIYRVAVSYVGEGGQVAQNTAGAFWGWLKAGGGGWTAAVRLSYWDEAPAESAGFDERVARALGVGRPPDLPPAGVSI